MVSVQTLCSILLFVLPQFEARAEILTLTQKDVAERVLRDSNQSKEIDYETGRANLPLAQALGIYDYTVSATTSYEVSQLESFTNNFSNKDQTLLTTLSFKKPFSSGTTLGFDYQRKTLNYDLMTTGGTLPPPQQTQDYFVLSVEQNLLKNSFGIASRANLRAAESTYRAANLTRANQLQELVLTTLRQFWTTYVAQESFQESINSRARYQQLVASIKKKSSYGYAGPGELAQVQAELESREQTVKTESANYLKALDQLISLLKLPANAEIKFSVPSEVPNLPELPKTDLSKLRSIKSQELKLQAAKEIESATISKSSPDLNLTLQGYRAGLEETPEGAYSEMLSGTHPKYFIGLKFQYNFGSGLQSEEVREKRLARMIEESKKERQLQDLQDRENQLSRNISSLYSQVISLKNQRGFREKAVQELTKSYNQGRTDISFLIDAINKYFASEIQYSKVIGDYQVSLNEWAALRDELIPTPTEL